MKKEFVRHEISFNMEKEFVIHEISLELKQLGFDEPCLRYYDYFSNLVEYGVYECKAPLYRQVFTWFREKYSLIGEIFSQLRPSNNFMYGFKIGGSDIIFDGFQTYEEAELACLLKLIEIVKESI